MGRTLQLTPDELREARAWLAELSFADADPDEFATMPDHKIERGIARFYDGGIEAFKATFR